MYTIPFLTMPIVVSTAVMETTNTQHEATATAAKDPDAEAAEKLKESLEGLSEELSNFDFEAALKTANAHSDPDKNFTWEHFFTKQCGILREDALKYETALIAHRMSPLETLLESVDLILEYGRIPIGDKMKIMKTIESASKGIDSIAQGKSKAKKSLGLDHFSDFEAGLILELGGGETEYHIEYGMEQLEDINRELERMAGLALLKDPKAADMYKSGSAAARAMANPALGLLNSFGYETFEYTKDKRCTDETIVPTVPTSSDPAVDGILFGNLRVQDDLSEHMYS